MIRDRIILFLRNRAWEVSNQTEVFTELRPPDDLTLPNTFRLYVPRKANKADSENFLNNILKIIAEFYSLSVDDLNVVLKNENTVLKIRVYDKQNEDGKISLLKFEELVEKIKFILSDTASFVIDKSITSTRTPLEVSKYLSLCNFMQTEKGSFVAKIQLPNKEVIKERELFDREAVYSKEINEKLCDILSFVKDNILEGSAEATEEYLLQNESKINIKLYKDIEAFFDKTNLKNIDFSFHTIASSNTITNENVTREKLYKLNQFVEQIESHAFEVGSFSVKGKITTLKSKNPDGLKNNVTLIGTYENNPLIAIANLDSEHYKEAIEAHKLKKEIIVTGLGKRTTTRIRFIEITKFQIVE